MNLTIIGVFYFCPSRHTLKTAMPISFNSPLHPLSLFMLSSRQEPAYWDHLHYPKWICFEVGRFCEAPLIPHEKMFKAHTLTGTDVHYHWICLSPPLRSVLVIEFLVSFPVFSILPLQKLAPCWANPHFKALCLSAGNKAHTTYYGSFSFPSVEVNTVDLLPLFHFQKILLCNPCFKHNTVHMHSKLSHYSGDYCCIFRHKSFISS